MSFLAVLYWWAIATGFVLILFFLAKWFDQYLECRRQRRLTKKDTECIKEDTL
jgi:hypothetical protein